MILDKGFYTTVELISAGFKSIGKNVKISRNSTIIGQENISIGDNSRIDDYCMLVASGTGYISIGSNVHIAGYCLLSGGSGIVMEDYSGISHGVKVYSRTDDYSGEYLTNPTVPECFTGGDRGAVTIKKHAIVGSGSVILPNLTIGEGVSVGAQSLITKDLEPWFVYFGCPVKKLKPRKKALLELEEKHNLIK